MWNRVATSTQFNDSLRMSMTQQNEIATLREQIAAGKKILKPSDDPVMATRIVRVKSTAIQLEQFNRTANELEGNLMYQEETVQQGIDALQKARETAIRAKSPAINSDNASSLAEEIHQISQFMLGVTNARDENNAYIFAGYESDSEAFNVIRDAAGHIVSGTYDGDNQSSYRDIGLGQRIKSNTPGNEIFVNDAGESVFDILGKMANELEAGNPPSTAIEDIDSIMEKMVKFNASAGVRTNQVEGMTSINTNLSNAMESSIAEVEGLDMAEGIMRLEQHNAQYQATLQTFAKVQKMSLFNYLN